MKEENKKKLSEIFTDLGVCFAAGIIVAYAFHSFINCNDFAPGGINGFAGMLGYIFHFNMGYFNLILNIPIFACVFILVSKHTGIMLTVYLAIQSSTLILLDYLSAPVYLMPNNLILAAIAGGVISGIGFSLMLRRFGASGGTYAISSLIKRKHPSSNLAWVAFFMDSLVVVVSIFVYRNSRIESAICTLINLFIANYVVEYALKGLKRAFKFEIITNNPEELAGELMEKLHHGVTCVKAVGMYEHNEHSLLICVVRKRQLGEFMKIIKNHNDVFAYFAPTNEVFGNFK